MSLGKNTKLNIQRISWILSAGILLYYGLQMLIYTWSIDETPKRYLLVALVLGIFITSLYTVFRMMLKNWNNTSKIKRW